MLGKMLARLLFPGLCAFQAGFASQFLVVVRAPNGSLSFQAVESIAVNGKDKLRAASLAGAQQPSWDSKALGHAAETRLSEFSVIRRSADGALIGRTPGGDWRLLLPEGVKSKTPETAPQLWKESSIGLKKERKDKSGEAVRLNELYAVVPGLDPAASSASLATDIALHEMPGVSEGDAFRELVTLLPQAAKAFPTGASNGAMRDFLQHRMTDRLKAWQDGDAEVKVLDEAGALASAAEAAFPSDAALTTLRTQTRTARQQLDRRVAILRALDAGKQADAFLLAYRDFEPYDRSFAALAKARKQHLNTSAASHLATAQELRKRGDYAGAIHHLLIAKWRNPKLEGVDENLEQVRLEAARLSAQKYAEARGNIDTRSPAQVQVQRKLLLAEQYLADGKRDEAEKSLGEAAVIAPDEPRLALLQAKLAIAGGDLGRALAMLDNYAGTAPTPQDFAEGEKLRASVLYTIQKERSKFESQIPGEMNAQRFTAALEAAADGLKVDNESPEFLYHAGIDTCILRNCDKAAPLLHRYLDLTDSAQGERAQRIVAIRLLREAETASSRAVEGERQERKERSSWFSGAALGRGVFYDPISLAFQPKVARIDASEHVTVSYDWRGEQLAGVHTKYEEKKTASNIARVAVAAAAASQGIGSTVGWRTAGRETNDFYFSYYDEVPQIMKVGRDNTVVKSRRIPVSIPGIGFPGMGMFGGIGLLGGLGNLRGMMGGGMLGGGLRGAGLPGMPAGGLAGIGTGGLPGMGGLANLGSMFGRAGAFSAMGQTGGFSSFSAGRQFIPGQQYSIHSDPQGGSSAGYLTLWNNPRIDTRLAWKVTGKRAAVGFSGNRFFHPFAWDGIHLFEFDYDENGRVLHAWELGESNAVRLDFTWDGQRLLKITGRDASPAQAVQYTRVLNYNGDRLTSEVITYEGKSSKIEYKYDKQGRIVEADCDADHSLDGRSRKAHFLAEGDK